MHDDNVGRLGSHTAALVEDPSPALDRPHRPSVMSVSAVIPVFNGKHYLAEAVASVAAQTILPRELILVDDGSEDGSISAIDARTLPFPVRIVHQANAGQSAARNHGARVAQGEFIALLDQDDRWYSHHLERLLAPFREQPMLGFTYSNLDEIDREGRLVCIGRLNTTGSVHPKLSLAEMLSSDMFIVPSATLIRRDAMLSVGGFDEQFSGYEDDDLFIRMFRAGHRHVFLDESLSQWRIYSNSTSYSRRMDISRRRFADKLIELCPNEPALDQWWVRDYIAPRFFRNALRQYHAGVLDADWALCRTALAEAREFGRLMVTGPRLRLRLALMRYPRLYRLLYLWLRRDPALLQAPRTARPKLGDMPRHTITPQS